MDQGSPTLNIMQWNAQSLLSNQLELQKFLYENAIHIALISETWLRPHIKFNIRNYSVVRNDWQFSQRGSHFNS